MADVDAIVIGKAPDMLERRDARAVARRRAGCRGKPVFRVHTAGSVGGSTAIVAAQHVIGGVHDVVLTIGFEKQSDGNAMWALSVAIPFGMPVHAGAGGYFAPHVRTYIDRTKAPGHIGVAVAVKDRTNALDNPYAHLHEAGWTIDKALESPMLWDPIRFVETCPSSDGAMALVLMSEGRADAMPGPKAWVHGRPCAASRRCSPVMGQ